MPAFSPVDAAVTSSASIGKYFSIISVIPSSLLVLYVFVLISAGAWTGPMQPGQITIRLGAFSWQDLAWFIAATLLVALATHPLQYPLTQLLEGYWGTSRLGIHLTVLNVNRHHRKAVHLRAERDAAFRAWVRQGSQIWQLQDSEPTQEIVGQEFRDRERDARRALALPQGVPALPQYVAHQAYEKRLAVYPRALHRTMPTRLGNVLRQSEDAAGKQYGLDTLVIAPHLSLVAKPGHYSYVEDRQKAMDLAISMCLVWALATFATAVLLSDDGPWCLLSLVPFGLSYASYLGAVHASRAYNVALETVTDLSRFELYDAMHVPHPATGQAERDLAQALMGLMRGVPQPSLLFVAPGTPGLTATSDTTST